MLPEYIYRHKCDKPIYEVSEGNMRVEVTEDHSLFNSDKTKIKPSEINELTKLEYYEGEMPHVMRVTHNDSEFIEWGGKVAEDETQRIPYWVYNSSPAQMKLFYRAFMTDCNENANYSKTVLAGLQYIKKLIEK